MSNMVCESHHWILVKHMSFFQGELRALLTEFEVESLTNSKLQHKETSRFTLSVVLQKRTWRTVILPTGLNPRSTMR